MYVRSNISKDLFLYHSKTFSLTKCPYSFGGQSGFLSCAVAFCFFFPSEVDDGADCVFDAVVISTGIGTISSQSEELRSWYGGRFAPLELPSLAIFSCRWKDVLQ